MSTIIQAAEMGSLSQKSGFASPNTLFPSILATVLLCGILTTFFTAARLITKRLISTYDVEDCEFQLNLHPIFRISDTESRLDFLILAWVGTESDATKKKDIFADFR